MKLFHDVRYVYVPYIISCVLRQVEWAAWAINPYFVMYNDFFPRGFGHSGF